MPDTFVITHPKRATFIRRGNGEFAVEIEGSETVLISEYAAYWVWFTRFTTGLNSGYRR